MSDEALTQALLDQRARAQAVEGWQQPQWLRDLIDAATPSDWPSAAAKIGETVLSVLPGSGEVMAARDSVDAGRDGYQALRDGRYGDAAGDYARALAAGLGAVPMFGPAFGVVKQVGKGVFGPQIAASSWREAVDALKVLQKETPGQGEIVGHVQHPSVGDIGVPWGRPGTGASDGWGMSKLLEYHPEVVDELPSIISGMEKKSEGANRIRLDSPDHTAVVRKTWDDLDKNWLLSAFGKKNTPP